MKKKKLLCLALVSTLLLASASLAFAEPGKSNKNGKPEKTTTQNVSKELKSEKTDSTQQKDQLKSEKDQLKTQTKANLAEKKRLIKEQYTSAELAAINQAGENIKNSDQTTSVLEVTSIVSDKKFKFDTPPVIKGNRTLIPVRAITEGMGADVKWDAATKQITIVKDQTTIVLVLGETTALVNGVEVKLDTNANTMNNRTYVPLRFIMETLKLKVTYDDGTIEINDPVDTTTDGAIDTTSPVVTTTQEAIDTTTQEAIDTTTQGAIVTTTQRGVQ